MGERGAFPKAAQNVSYPAVCANFLRINTFLVTNRCGDRFMRRTPKPTPRRLVLLLLGMSLLVACSTGGKQTKAEPATEKPEVPAYFEQIPSESYFVFAGVEPFPEDMVASLLTAGTALSETAQTYGESAEERVDRLERGEELEYPDRPTAVLRGMADGLTPATLEEDYGIARSPHVAAYAVGNVFVARVELSDPVKFREGLAEIDDRFEFEPIRESHAQIDYLRYDDALDSGGKRQLLLRVTPDEVIAAAPLKSQMDTFVPYFVGEREVAQSLADAGTLREMRDEYGFRSFALGYFDLEELFAIGSGQRVPDGLGGELINASDFVTDYEEHMSAEEARACREESLRLGAFYGRVVMGFHAFDDRTFDFAVGMESNPDVRDEIPNIRKPIPGWETDVYQTSAVALGLGLDAESVVGLARSPATVPFRGPFECPWLQSLGSDASRLERMTASIPKGLLTIEGVQVLVGGLDIDLSAFEQGGVESPLVLRSMVVLSSSQPKTLLAMAAQMMPQLQAPMPQPEDDPRPLPWLDQMHPVLASSQLHVTEQAVGVTVGDGTSTAVGPVMSGSPGQTPIAVVRLNARPLMKDLMDATRERLELVQKRAEESGEPRADEFEAAWQAVEALEARIPSRDDPVSISLSVETLEGTPFLRYRYTGPPLSRAKEVEDMSEQIDVLFELISPPG